jgi:hypothetical protein
MPPLSLIGVVVGFRCCRFGNFLRNDLLAHIVENLKFLLFDSFPETSPENLRWDEQSTVLILFRSRD